VHPADRETAVAPMVSQKQCERVQSIAEGAQVLVGGEGHLPPVPDTNVRQPGGGEGRIRTLSQQIDFMNIVELPAYSYQQKIPAGR
jgi:hypothetical protein